MQLSPPRFQALWKCVSMCKCNKVCKSVRHISHLRSTVYEFWQVYTTLFLGVRSRKRRLTTCPSWCYPILTPGQPWTRSWLTPFSALGNHGLPVDVTPFSAPGNHRLPVDITPFSAPDNYGLPSWAYVKTFFFSRVLLNIPTVSPLASWLLQLQLVFWDSSTLWGDIPLLIVLFIHPPVNRHLCCFQSGSLEVRGLFVHTFSHGHMFSVPLHKHLKWNFWMRW